MLPTQSSGVAVGGTAKAGEGGLEERGDRDTPQRGSWRAGRVELRGRDRCSGDAERAEAEQACLPGVAAVEGVRRVVVVVQGRVGEDRRGTSVHY